MTTDAHTEQLTDGVAQVAPAAPETPSAFPAPGQPATPAAHVPAPGQPEQHGAYTAPPQFGAPQYGAPQYAAPATPQQLPGQHSYGFAIASFVIGIASIIGGWTLIAPAVGLVLGILALRRNTTERTLALWGVWLNGVILAFAAVGIVIVIALASFGMLAGTMASFGW